MKTRGMWTEMERTRCDKWSKELWAQENTTVRVVNRRAAWKGRRKDAPRRTEGSLTGRKRRTRVLHPGWLSRPCPGMKKENASKCHGLTAPIETYLRGRERNDFERDSAGSGKNKALSGEKSTSYETGVEKRYSRLYLGKNQIEARSGGTMDMRQHGNKKPGGQVTAAGSRRKGKKDLGGSKVKRKGVPSGGTAAVGGTLIRGKGQFYEQKPTAWPNTWKKKLGNRPPVHEGRPAKFD